MVQENNFNTEPFGRTLNIVLFSILTISLIIIAFGGEFIAISWGIDQAAFLPGYLYCSWLILSVAIIFWLLIRSPEKSIVTHYCDYLWNDKKTLTRLAFLLFILAIFIIFKYQAHLYGNGYIRISNFAQRAKPVFRWYEYGGAIIPYMLYKVIALLGLAKESAAELGYQIVSFFSGVSFLYIVLKIAELITADRTKRLLILLLALFSGFSFFFFGMVEVYPILIPLGAFFVYLVVKSLKERKSRYLYYLWGIIIVGLVINLQFLTAIPAAIYVTILHLQKKWEGFSLIGWISAVSGLAGGVVILYMLAGNDIAIENGILLFQGKPPEADYGLFGAHHLLDVLNLFFQMEPLFLVFIFFAIISIKGIMKDNMSLSLRILAGTQFVALFIIDPKNGMARDFASYGFLMTGFIFLGVYAISIDSGRLKLSDKIRRILAPAALLLFLPAMILHLSPEMTVSSLDKFLTYNETKYGSAYFAMRDYYYLSRNFTEADRREQSVVSKAKGALESRLVEDLYAHDRVDESFAYANRLVESDPYNATYRMQKGNLLKHFKKYNDASEQYDTAIMLDPYRTDLYHYRADLYREMGLKQRQFDELKMAEGIDPENTLILADLASYYYTAGMFSLTDSLADLIISLDSASAYAYMYKGLVAERNSQLDKALQFYYKFDKLGQRLPEITYIRKRINELELQPRSNSPGK